MISTEVMMMILTPIAIAGFAGLCILLTMAWVMSVDEIAQERARREEAANDTDNGEGINQVVPDSDDSEDGSEQNEVTVSHEIFNTLLKTVEEEKAKTERMQQVIYQLLGGLYNHDTQEKTMMFDVNYLYGDKQTEDGAYETEEDSVVRQEENWWPTTRQGDENTKQIAQLKEELNIKCKEQYECGLDANEVYMRLHDLEEEVKKHEYRLNAVSGGVGARWDETKKTFKNIKTLEERIQDLERTMSVCTAFIQKQ